MIKRCKKAVIIKLVVSKMEYTELTHIKSIIDTSPNSE